MPTNTNPTAAIHNAAAAYKCAKRFGATEDQLAKLYLALVEACLLRRIANI